MVESKFTDQTGFTLALKQPVQRIVSLVPSQSELLWDLGLEKELVGITKFCIYPSAMYQSIQRIGGTKQVNREMILQLHPDLIIGNKEENTKEDIEYLRRYFPVWLSDVNDFGDAMGMMEQVAMMTNRVSQWEPLKARIEIAMNGSYHLFKGLKVAYAIWHEPWMFVGHSTYIDAVLRHLGMVNVLGHLSRYPLLSIQELTAYTPDLILLSEEPFPFKEAHAREVRTLFPNTKVVCFSGEPFSWYGSRMQFLYNDLLPLKQLIG